MKLLLSFLVVIISSVASPSFADDLTASDLAKHLRVFSWVSSVTLPPGSFSVAILHVVNGKIMETMVGGMSGPIDDPTGQRLVVMTSVEADGNRTTISLGGSAAWSSLNLKSQPNVPILGSASLLDQIGEGDYCLGGKYRTENGVTMISRGGAERLEDGLLLKITKR